MSKYNPEYIDDEERDMMEAMEGMDVNKLEIPSKKEQQELKTAAKDYLKTNTKMNIRIDPLELEKIKEQAELAGLKYQTFVKSVLHKYITGQLIEKDKKAGSPIKILDKIDIDSINQKTRPARKTKEEKAKEAEEKKKKEAEGKKTAKKEKPEDKKEKAAEIEEIIAEDVKEDAVADTKVPVEGKKEKGGKVLTIGGSFP